MSAQPKMQQALEEKTWRIATRIQSFEFHREQYGENADVYLEDQLALIGLGTEDDEPPSWIGDYTNASDKIQELIRDLLLIDQRLQLTCGKLAIGLFRLEDGVMELRGSTDERGSALIIDTYHLDREAPASSFPTLYVGDMTKQMFVTLSGVGKTLNSCGSPSITLVPSIEAGVADPSNN